MPRRLLITCGNKGDITCVCVSRTCVFPRVTTSLWTYNVTYWSLGYRSTWVYRVYVRMMPASVYKLHIFGHNVTTGTVMRVLWTSVRRTQTNASVLNIVFAHRNLYLSNIKLTSIAAGDFVNLRKLEWVSATTPLIVYCSEGTLCVCVSIMLTPVCCSVNITALCAYRMMLTSYQTLWT